MTSDHLPAYKVGIITNYANTNYGSVLQSCALQEILSQIGVYGENIRWRAQAGKKHSSLYRAVRWTYRTAARPLSAKRRRVYAFQRFRRQYIRESKEDYTAHSNPESLNDIYDAFICGSDQIWAPNQFHERYYLNFAHDNKSKIAYAPSIGLPEIPEPLKPKMADLMNRIDYLSIREQAGAVIVKQLTGRDAEVVLDPTLLLDRDAWLKMAKNETPTDDYILCYFLGENPEHRRAAEIWQQKTGWPLVVLPFREIDKKWGNHQLVYAGPDKFLALIENSRWVLTDSYHGTIFSIIMNKPFFSFMRFTENHPLCQNSRVEHLLGRLGLLNQIVSSPSMDFSRPDPIDYEAVKKKIAADRSRSIHYLENALGRKCCS